MSDENATEIPKKRVRKSPQNGVSDPAPESGESVVDAVTEAAPVPVPETPAPAPQPVLPGIEVLPDEVQGMLKSFKSQLSEAPPVLQAIISNFLFGSVPAAPMKTEETPKSAVDPMASTEPAPQAQTQAQETESPVVRRFAEQRIPEGFQNLPSMMIYSSFANGFAPMRALAVDVLQWGSKPVIIARCSNPVKVLSAEGEIVEIPPKMVFAIPAESDLISFVRPLTEDPTNAYEIFFAPTCIEKDDSGSSIVRYKVALGTRVPKAAVWPPK